MLAGFLWPLYLGIVLVLFMVMFCILVSTLTRRCSPYPSRVYYVIETKGLHKLVVFSGLAAMLATYLGDIILFALIM